MTTRLLIAAFAATASLAVAACGEDTPTGSGASGGRGPDAETRKAMLDHAKCMRENGVDMPDPKFEEGGRVTQTMGGPGKNIDPQEVEAAEKECKKYTDKIKPPEMSEADREEFRKRALEHSKCMREHGIDMPDPTFDENGGAQVRLGGPGGEGIRPDDPKFKEAQKACGNLMGGGASKTDVEEDGQ